MIPVQAVQILTACTGSTAFGVLFNLKGRRLLAAGVGGLLSWGLFLLLHHWISDEALCYFIVAVTLSLYAEVCARLLKTPATPLATTALIPLIPGGSLYYTMISAFEGNADGFLSKAVSTLQLAAALALGIIVVLTFSHLLFTKREKKKEK